MVIAKCLRDGWGPTLSVSMLKPRPLKRTSDARQNSETVLDQDGDGMTHSPPSKENEGPRSMLLVNVTERKA